LCSNKALLDARPSLAETIRPVMNDEKTSIVLLQNGVGAEEPLHEAFPGNTVISAVVWTGAKVLDQGKVEQFNREALTIGVDWKEKLGKGNEVERERLDRLVSVLKAGGGECNVVDDIQSERWVKVIWNACWNAVTTATQLRTNRFLEASPYALELSRSIMGEVVQVARAKGLTVPEGTIDKLIEQCTSVKGGLPSSMLFDYLAGRPMEVEFG
jgi:2-dehydropantoate 2-reductase